MLLWTASEHDDESLTADVTIITLGCSAENEQLELGSVIVWE